MHDIRQFFPLDTLAEVRDALALNGHRSRMWNGDRDIGQQPCPCRTHLEARLLDGVRGWLVWHGCASLELFVEDFDQGPYPERDPRLLSAICNWLVDLHEDR